MNAAGKKKAIKQCKDLLITLVAKKRSRKRHSGSTVLKRKKKKWDALDAAAALTAQDKIANEARNNNGVKSVIVSPSKADNCDETSGNEETTSSNKTSLFGKEGQGKADKMDVSEVHGSGVVARVPNIDDDNNEECEQLFSGSRVAKKSGGLFIFGTVISCQWNMHKEIYWYILYDVGVDEEILIVELEERQQLYQEHQGDDQVGNSKQPATTTAPPSTVADDDIATMVALQNDGNYCGKVDEINLSKAQIASKECYTREQHLSEKHTEHDYKIELLNDTLNNNDVPGLLKRHPDLSPDSSAKSIREIENAQECLDSFNDQPIVPPRAILELHGNDILMESQKEVLELIQSTPTSGSDNVPQSDRKYPNNTPISTFEDDGAGEKNDPAFDGEANVDQNSVGDSDPGGKTVLITPPEIGKRDKSSDSEELTPTALFDNLNLDNQTVEDGVLNSQSAANGDTTGTGTSGDNGADVPVTPADEQTADTSLIKLGSIRSAVIGSGKTDTAIGECGHLGNNNAGASEGTLGVLCHEEDVDSAATGEKLVGGGSDTESEDMWGFQDEETDKGVLDGEAESEAAELEAKKTAAGEDEAVTAAEATASEDIGGFQDEETNKGVLDGEAESEAAELEAKKTAAVEDEAVTEAEAAASESVVKKTAAEDMGIANEKTDDDSSAKDVLGGGASTKNKSATNAATVAVVTKKKAAKKKALNTKVKKSKKMSPKKKSTDWTIEEEQLCAKSLYPHGKSTTFARMNEFVTTRTISQIRYYWGKHQKMLMTMSEIYFRDQKYIDGLAKDKGMTDVNDIIDGARNRNFYNEVIIGSSQLTLLEFVKEGIFEELKEQVVTNSNPVYISGIGTFYTDKNGRMALTHSPYPPYPPYPPQK